MERRDSLALGVPSSCEVECIVIMFAMCETPGSTRQISRFEETPVVTHIHAAAREPGFFASLLYAG